MSVFHSVRELFLSRMDGKGGEGMGVEEEVTLHLPCVCACVHVCVQVHMFACVHACV